MRKSARRSSGASAVATGYTIVWNQAAVIEFNGIKEAKARTKIMTVAELLRQIGPKLVEPHCKKVQGEQKLFELRPGGGKLLLRPLFARADDRTFIVLAIAPEAVTDKSGFDSARKRSRTRALADHDLVV